MLRDSEDNLWETGSKSGQGAAEPNLGTFIDYPDDVESGRNPQRLMSFVTTRYVPLSRSSASLCHGGVRREKESTMRLLSSNRNDLWLLGFLVN